jgi:hypothetical protein
MVVDWVPPAEFRFELRIWLQTVPCSWVEDRQKKAATFHIDSLQTVHADGSPRSYDDE